MLVRVGGGTAGIKQYLEDGRKQGRGQTRDELDERVILSGDLEITDLVIDHFDSAGDKYWHVTLSFKEDEISRETLQAITEEFRQFAFAAYRDDEYTFYAEAHLGVVVLFVQIGALWLEAQYPCGFTAVATPGR